VCVCVCVCVCVFVCVCVCVCVCERVSTEAPIVFATNVHKTCYFSSSSSFILVDHVAIFPVNLVATAFRRRISKTCSVELLQTTSASSRKAPVALLVPPYELLANLTLAKVQI
jgi:hypothetical protein